MTRINVGIPPRKLTDSHLLAEHREIKRLCKLFAKNNLNNIPSKFTLGTGHLLFFMDKGLYLRNRYIELYDECLTRNFDIEYYANNWDDWSKSDKYYNDYNPTDADRQLIIDRISTRLFWSNEQPRYFREPVSKEFAINLLKF